MKNGTCYNCAFFQIYYMKKSVQFIESDFGFCFNDQQNKSVHDCCDEYKVNSMCCYLNHAAKSSVDNLLLELTTLRNFLEKDKEKRDERKKLR